MKAEEQYLYKDFVKLNDIDLKVPVYQRAYCWDEKNNTKVFLDDLESLIYHPDNEHFFGTIVWIEHSSPDERITQKIIVDGQQRITTFMLFAKALYDSLDSEEDEDLLNDIAYYIIKNNSSNKNKEPPLKLTLVESDRKHYMDLVYDNRVDKNSHIYKNYLACKRRIERWLSTGITPQAIFSALTRLTIVGIRLDKNDDPQKIFASLNSTGQDLAQSDLIRNYLLMSQKDMESLHKNYWTKIEEVLQREVDDGKVLDDFLVHYLIAQTQQFVNRKKVYQNFFEYCENNRIDKVDMLKALTEAAKTYSTFKGYTKSPISERVDELLEQIRCTQQTTIYPLLIKIFDDYEKKIINEAELREVLEMLASFLIRRQIVGKPSSGLNRFFVNFYARAFRNPENQRHYVDAIKNIFEQNKTTDMYFPSNNEVVENLKSINIYQSNKNLCRLLLSSVENSGHEKIKVEDMTIEHVMPQTMTPQWRIMLNCSEEEYLPFLHNIGNLTLTGYNSDLSNKPFEEKKRIIREKSKFNTLNEDILSSEAWGLNEIKRRSNRLAELVVDRFPEPDLDNLNLASGNIEVSLEEAYNLRNDKTLALQGYKYNDIFYPEHQMSKVSDDLIYLMNREKPEKMLELAQMGYTPGSSKRFFITIHKDLISKRPGKIPETDIYYERNYSSSNWISNLLSLKQTLGLESEIKLRYRIKD